MSNANLVSVEEFNAFMKDIEGKIKMSKTSINTNISAPKTTREMPAHCKICGNYVGKKYYSIRQTNNEPPTSKCMSCGTEFQASYDMLTDSYVFTFNCGCKKALTKEFLEDLKYYKKEVSLVICNECARSAGIEEVFGIENL